MPSEKNVAATMNNGGDGAVENGKKRKRNNGTSKPKEVNGNNLADLWEAVIEGKKKSKKHDKKRQKVEKTETSTVEKSVGGAAGAEKHNEKKAKVEKEFRGEKSEVNSEESEKQRPKSTNAVARRMIAHDLGIKLDKNEDEGKVKVTPTKEQDGDEDTKADEKKHKNSKKEKKREKRAALEKSADGSTPSTKTEETPTKIAAPVPKPTPQLTPLQASMRRKLISARFRHLNETLYTKPSAHSLSLFQENPEMFSEYHEGFRRQVEVWPENPVDSYITTIKIRGKIRGPQRGKGGDKKSDVIPGGATPLPRTEGTSIIADLGCGDAVLATALHPLAKKLHLKLHSFDLQSQSPLVTKADIANLPLGDGSVDIAIFCLALMGTNWIDFIEEAFRILRWKGELWVAEIKSRFGRVGGKGKRVEHSVGNRKKSGPENKKEKKRAEEESNDLVAAVEIDGVEDKGGETNVSAFVEVLRKRGFVLKEGEGGVDLTNKMFVKMCFVKGVTPIKGKCVPVPKGMEKFAGGETWKKKPKGRFIDEEDEHVSSEAGVLKPCVYKLR